MKSHSEEMTIIKYWSEVSSDEMREACNKAIDNCPIDSVVNGSIRLIQVRNGSVCITIDNDDLYFNYMTISKCLGLEYKEPRIYHSGDDYTVYEDYLHETN